MTRNDGSHRIVRPSHRIARALSALAVGLGIAVLPVLVQPAAAAAGAIGAIDGDEWDGTYNVDLPCDSTACLIDVTGWAYNKNTRPVQAVQLHFYSAGGTLLHVSGQYAAVHGRTSPVKYDSYGWEYANRAGGGDGLGAYLPRSFEHVASWRKVCAFTHDKGEPGGYVRIGCATVKYEPTSTPIRHF